MGHNEPSERAESVTGKVTAKALLQVIRAGGSSFYVHGEATPYRPSYSDSFVFTCTSVRKERPTGRKDGSVLPEVLTTITIPGEVHGGHTSARELVRSEHGAYMRYTEAFRPQKGFWSFFGACDRLVDVLEVVPGDAEIAFEIYLDGGTNEGLIRASVETTCERAEGLHADHFYLVVTHAVRGRPKTRRFLVDTSTGAHNTARFGAR